VGLASDAEISAMSIAVYINYLVPHQPRMRKPLQTPRTSQSNKPIRYQGAGPSNEITLNPIYSYSYRADSSTSISAL
jgi:hypothetical protein